MIVLAVTIAAALLSLVASALWIATLRNRAATSHRADGDLAAAFARAAAAIRSTIPAYQQLGSAAAKTARALDGVTAALKKENPTP